MSSDWPVASALMAGRYRLVSLLETGGMAEIWRATDELLDRPVAVKLPTGPQVVWREARMAARLSHPGIAAVHDYREAVRPDGTVVPFVVMELLTGESVAARVDRELIGWAETARIGAAVADALAAAHASGVVHRDIKPGNVMLTPNGVKILDFGISVAAGEPDDDDTGATFGTPAYVAPERLDGMPAEPATDVYGVGVLLFEMVTGDPPYAVETWEELAAARVNGPSELPESLPSDFRDVVNRCLDADPAGRPTAARLRADLLAVALRARPPAPSSVSSESASSSAPSSAVSTAPSSALSSAPSSVPSPGLSSASSSALSSAPSSALSPGLSSSSSSALSSSPSSEPSSARSSSPSSEPSSTLSSSPSSEPFSARSSSPSSASGIEAAPSVARNGGSASRGEASGAVGNLVRAAGVSPGSFGRSTGHARSDEVGESVGARTGGARRPARTSFAYSDSDESRDWRPEGSAVATRNFATGRASAATLDMEQAPRRRAWVGISAAVVLAALVGAFAVLTWTQRDRDREVAVPPVVTTPAPKASAPAPTPSATTAGPTSATPSPKASLTFADAVSRMRAAVKGGEASGQIRGDVADDLLNLLKPLSNAQGSDLTGQVQALREKIRTRVGEGGVSEARAAVLQSRLEDLDRAAGT
jgi:eukaryotic-like serine/threonine-protein kinase